MDIQQPMVDDGGVSESGFGQFISGCGGEGWGGSLHSVAELGKKLYKNAFLYINYFSSLVDVDAFFSFSLQAFLFKN